MMEEGREAKSKDASPAFEEILARLHAVVERLETGDMPLEDSLSLFEEGVRLSRLGSARLDEAERRVERLLHHDGSTEVMNALSDSASSQVLSQVEARAARASGQKETEVP